MAKEITPDIRILPAEPRWAKSLTRALGEVAREKDFLLNIDGPSLERVQKFVAKMQEVGNPQFVAVLDNEVVGWSDIRRLEQSVLSHAGELGMGVLRDFRGQGLGQKLLETCLTAAWSLNFLKVNLTVFSGNTAAIALYKKVGFQQDGVLRRHAQVEGVFRDSLFMSLLREDALEKTLGGKIL